MVVECQRDWPGFLAYKQANWHSSRDIPMGHKISNCHQIFRHVAVPLNVGRRMYPEEKVILKTDFDLPIATCYCSASRSWQGSLGLSSRNRCQGTCKIQRWWESAEATVDCSISQGNYCIMNL